MESQFLHFSNMTEKQISTSKIHPDNLKSVRHTVYLGAGGDYIGLAAPRFRLQVVTPKHAGWTIADENTYSSEDNQLIASFGQKYPPQYTFSGKTTHQEDNLAGFWNIDSHKREATAQDVTLYGGPIGNFIQSAKTTDEKRIELYRILDRITHSIRLGCPPLTIINYICDAREIASTHDAERASELVLRLVNMTRRRNGRLPPRCTSDMFTRPVAEILSKALQGILNVIDGFESSDAPMRSQVLETFAIEINRLFSWCRLAGLLHTKGIIVTEVVYKLLGTLLGAGVMSQVRYRATRVLTECAGARLCADGQNWRVGSMYGGILSARLEATRQWTPVYNEIWKTLWQLQSMRQDAVMLGLKTRTTW